MAIEKLKAKAGIGGAKIEILVPKEKYNREEMLKGEVLLSGGKVAQEITVLSISLIREWNWECYVSGWDMTYEPGFSRGPYSAESISIEAEYELDGDKGKDEVLHIELAKDLEIAPDNELKFPFKIDLSSIQSEKGVNEKWKLKSRADIPFSKDAIATREIKIEKKKKH